MRGPIDLARSVPYSAPIPAAQRPHNQRAEETRVDARRFDSLTRSLAAPKTRRGFLGTLAAVGAGFFGARIADAQVTQAQCGNTSCRTNPGKCAAGCVCCV